MPLTTDKSLSRATSKANGNKHFENLTKAKRKLGNKARQTLCFFFSAAVACPPSEAHEPKRGGALNKNFTIYKRFGAAPPITQASAKLTLVLKDKRERPQA